MTTTTNQKGRTLAQLPAVSAESETQSLAQMPSVELIQRELASAKSVNDFSAKRAFLPGSSPIRSSNY